ncbi:DNA methyltransferase [Methylibium sp. T29]|uniref:site-specific DNA-methyltransferase n=1 Tax=Methylibium sp. T29 TaxID=1430884 RepID=UPI0003F3D1E7|nr:DNA methyltransferase [Methylibium sp. T29]EWS54897.1 Modification methylase RsrI [Methylibium sp. T29]
MTTEPIRAPAVAATFQMMPVASLRPYERNARKHSKKQIRLIARSIEEFGFTNPLLIDRDGMVVAGHGRLEAAKVLGLTEVPTVRLDHFTPEQIRAYVIADNRLAEQSGWDTQLLTMELGELAKLGGNFDIRLTGFDTPAIDALLCPMQADDDEPLEPDVKAPPVSRVGDLWQLGRHRLLCGDATDPRAYGRLLGDQPAQMVFTDPPYNVPIAGNVTSGDRHGEFVMASGEMSPQEFTSFLNAVFMLLVANSVDGSIHFLCIDWRHLRELMDAATVSYTELKNLCVWNKANAGMGSLYRSKHELIFVYKAGRGAHINNIELGRHGRNRSNVWPYAGVTTPSKGRSQRLAMHPTVKPTAMIADAILDCSHRDGLVLDPFGGSGSTLLAAERTGRRAALMELDPRYVDVTVQRYLRSGGQAVLLEDVEGESSAVAGCSWAEVVTQRREDGDEQ